MKITAADYKIYADLKHANGRAAHQDERNNGIGTDLQDSLNAENAEIDKILSALQTICISCYCGGRSFYFEDVVQIGKTMYRGAEKVNKGNGYRSVKVIAKITDKMRADMIDDSYYY